MNRPLTPSRSRLALLSILLLIWAATAGPAAAHGEDGLAQVVDLPAGPYLVTVWTAPNPARPGPIHVAVAVADAATGRPLASPDVTIAAIPPGGRIEDETISALVGNEAETGYVYETNLNLDRTGQYEMVLSIAGPDGQGEVAFQLGIGSASLYTWFVLALSSITLPATVWIIKESLTTWAKHLPLPWRRSKGRAPQSSPIR